MMIIPSDLKVNIETTHGEQKYLYRWFASEKYRDAFLEGILCFSSRSHLHLHHDTDEFNVKRSSVTNCYSICFTSNSTGEFWQKKFGWKKAYGVKIEKQLFLKIFLNHLRSAITFEILGHNWKSILTSLNPNNKSINPDTLITTSSLPTFEKGELTNYYAHLQSLNEHNADQDLFYYLIKNPSELKATLYAVEDYQIQYYDPQKIHNSFQAIPHNIHKAKNFEQENEYRLMLSISDFRQYAKLPEINPTPFIQFLKIEYSALSSALSKVD